MQTSVRVIFILSKGVIIMTKLWVDLRGVILLFLSLVLILVMMNYNVRKFNETNSVSTNISASYEK